MNHNHEILITKQDVAPYIYFVCSMAQRGRMYGGLSGKSDYIGGVFDRWINIIPESVIFNKYFLPKIADNLEVISDYYEYDPKKSGIAPDVLGVKIGKKAIPFVEYVNKWRALKNAPQIEVKSFKKGQYMVSLRNQSYDKKYLVMAETNLDSDYLLPFFEQTVIGEDIYNKLKMDDNVFIKENLNKDLSSVTKIKRDNTNLGSLKLITVCLANDFMRYSNLCGEGGSPFYIKEINETRTPKTLPQTMTFSEWINKKIDNLYSWKENKLDNNKKHTLIDVYVENADKIQVLKNSKSSITIYTISKAKINDTELEANKTYIIKFQLLDRSGAKSGEYFMHKSIIDKIPNKEDIMLDNIKQYIR
ncbi:hypothetical protein A2356_01760 [Candidatus Nomurabacteria bacterium RIFOXYB1_FULL_39_16]|uniref:Uncharacterized protein n=2 Tax=Candidatus Nomuraibacteriota TaxID=1752729 RepID=A0A0G0T7W0_9BACT|nr:MAG: hypothetical protein UT78_C0008G0057 [Candidatus Nomurabacteria bacterium GW2011_GWF2_40_12]OGJ09083.1 MAG: hypothetical protein A2356_01760 [Candidatus Nomurabacteria bacterium RIFOXYB1_FULL_39_16]